MKKKPLLTPFFLVGCLLAKAQPHVHWKAHGNNYKIELSARVDKGWYLYSQRQPRGATAVPTHISFKTVYNDDALVVFDRAPEERGMMRVVKGAANERAWQYGNWVDFVQDINLLHRGPVNIQCTVVYQLCNDTARLPPDTLYFRVTVGGRH